MAELRPLSAACDTVRIVRQSGVLCLHRPHLQRCVAVRSARRAAHHRRRHHRPQAWPGRMPSQRPPARVRAAVACHERLQDDQQLSMVAQVILFGARHQWRGRTLAGCTCMRGIELSRRVQKKCLTTSRRKRRYSDGAHRLRTSLKPCVSLCALQYLQYHLPRGGVLSGGLRQRRWHTAGHLRGTLTHSASPRSQRARGGVPQQILQLLLQMHVILQATQNGMLRHGRQQVCEAHADATKCSHSGFMRSS